MALHDRRPVVRGAAGPVTAGPIVSDTAAEPRPTRTRRKQAHTVAERTLRRKIAIVGLNSRDEVIATVDDVQLTLPEGARHFRIVSKCAFCGSEIRVPVMEPDDLIDGVRRCCHGCIQGFL